MAETTKRKAPAKRTAGTRKPAAKVDGGGEATAAGRAEPVTVGISAVGIPRELFDKIRGFVRAASEQLLRGSPLGRNAQELRAELEEFAQELEK
jgi:hypothetical protein